MATGEKIKVTIDSFGRPNIEAVGFTGRSCVDVTAGIERALAGSDGDKVVVLKPEYHQEASEEAHAYEGQSW